MWADSLRLALRPRPMLEAVDLGTRLVQANLRTLARAYLPAAAVAALAAAATWSLDPFAPSVALLFLKPWLDRAALHVFARAAFGQATGPRDVWTRAVLLSASGFVRAVTIQRISPWRHFSQPIAQLEGVHGSVPRQRRNLLLRGKRGVALLVQSMFAQIELTLAIAFMSMLYWFTPFAGNNAHPGWMAMFDDQGFQYLFVSCQWMAAVCVEPFFVAAGFAMYLNRRVELEAWDVEQELRRAFDA